VVKTEAFPKVLLERCRSPRRGERGASGRETLVFLVSGGAGLRRWLRGRVRGDFLVLVVVRIDSGD
jgi:hypothetical protein